MISTSHFVWIELKSEVFSDLYREVWIYLKENDIEDIISFQNILSIHITLYYFEKDLCENDIKAIKNTSSSFVLNDISISGYTYFYRNEKEYLCYLWSQTVDNLENIRNIFHERYQRNDIEENTFSFIPHITFFKIQDFEVFTLHKDNIENIITSELEKIWNQNISSQNIYLYKVNSKFKEEIQIKI